MRRRIGWLVLVPLLVTACMGANRSPDAASSQPASWRPTGTTSSATSRFEVWVQELECASGESSEGRIVEPDIDFGASAITITFRVVPLPGGECRAAPPARYLVKLPEPIGLHELRDGSVAPSSLVRGAPTGQPRTGPYPGGPWSMDAQAWSDPTKEVWSDRALNMILGPAHCGWESSNFMHMGWPLGHEAKDSTEARQYIRDPLGIFGDAPSVPYEAEAALPDDARFTGLRNGDLELWISNREIDGAVYVVNGDGAERWPRANMIGCA